MPDILNKLRNASQEATKTERWTGTFEQYLDLVRNKEFPNLGVLSHQRAYQMIESSGKKKVSYFGQERIRYDFFEDKLFGVEHSIDEIMAYISSAAQRTETARRMLLLWGPPSSGKSDLVNLLKRGLEAWSRTEDGAVFAIKGSKMHENPFLLVPHNLRDEFGKEYGIHIEGALCPHTQWIVDHDYNGDFMRVPIERIFMSEAYRIGIGTWLPSDTKCLTEDCLITTPDGLRRGEDFRSSQIKSVIGASGQECSKVKTFNNGIRPVCKINLRGLSIESTPNHRFYVVNEDGEFVWCEAGDSLGQCMPVYIGGKHFGNEITLSILPESCYSEKCYPVTLPQKLTANLARMSGYLTAEGYCDDAQITFTNQDEQLNEDFQSIIKSEFDLDVPIYYRGEGDRGLGDLVLAESSKPGDVPVRNLTVVSQRGIVVSKRRFVDFVNQNFETNKWACEKRVPAVILKTTEENQIGFLTGLYLGDGTIYRRYNTAGISYSSCSERLVQDVQSMLLNFGVFSSISSYRDKKYPANLQYTLTVEGVDALKLADLLPQFVEHRGVDFTGTTTDHKNCYESFGSLAGMIKSIRDCTKHSRDIIDRRYTTSTSNGRSPTRKSLEKWLAFLQDDSTVITDPVVAEELIERIKTLLRYRCVPVTNVQYVGHKQVFDIEVDHPDHAFIANGIISHNSQDISELVGSIDYAKIQEYGDEADPRVFNFDGELFTANRGIMEFIEGLKADEKFLRACLTATQEKAVKAPRFGLISVDDFIIMHTNEEEFIDFMQEKRYEAYHDRMYIVKVPYNLSVSNEVDIYEKLLSGTEAISMNISPRTLESAGMFAVLTRLSDDETDLNRLQKMKLYDGQHVKGFKEEQVIDLKKKQPREGLSGCSPRFVIDQISAAISRSREEGRDYITALDVLRSLNTGVVNRDAFTPEQKTRYEQFIDDARKEWNDLLRNDIQKAFFLEYENEAKALCENYLDQIDASCSDTKPRDPVTGEEVDLDEKLMDEIETQIGITNSGQVEFRNEVLRAVSHIARKNEKLPPEEHIKFDYTQHAQLKEGIQKALFEERKGVIRMTVSSRSPDPEALERLNDVIKRMCKQQGYTPAAANELLKYASAHLFDK